MGWVLLVLGLASAVGGVMGLGTARIAIDKIESLLLVLIGAVLVAGAAIVRAVNRTRVAAEHDAEGGSGVRGDPWDDDEEPRGRARRLVNILSAAFVAVAFLALALWFVLPGVRPGVLGGR